MKTLINIFKSNLITYPKTRELAEKDFWKNINPGSLIYLRTSGPNHHGYDQYSHVAAFMGIKSGGGPTFAENAAGMKRGPEINRSLSQLLSMYPDGIPEELKACIVDVPRFSAKLWKERNEKVIPNLNKDLLNGYEIILIVNINSGLTTYWEITNKGIFKQEPFSNNKLELYSVTGRNLLARSYLTQQYQNYLDSLDTQKNFLKISFLVHILF